MEDKFKRYHFINTTRIAGLPEVISYRFDPCCCQILLVLPPILITIIMFSYYLSSLTKHLKLFYHLITFIFLW